MDHCERKKRKRNPRETANVLSLLTFTYTIGLFKKAYKNDLEEDDLYEVLQRCSSKKCGDKLEHQWIIENKRDPPPSIYRLLWKRFGSRYMVIGLVDLIWTVFKSVVEPSAISSLVSYFKPGQTKLTKADAYYNASIILFISMFQCLYIHSFVIWVIQLGIEIKTSFSSLLYRKALKLTPSAISEISLGNIVTLITKDVLTFQQSIWMINDTWIGIAQTIAVCYSLYSKIGVISFVGIGLLLGALPIQVYIGKQITKLRLATGKKTDERLQVTQESLSMMRIIKMYTWEKCFSDKINEARRKEVNKMLLGFYLRIVIIIVGVLFSKIGFYALIISYIWLGYNTDAELVFFILSNFKYLTHTLGIVIPYGMGRAAEFYSAMLRINKVINAEELHPSSASDEPTSKPLLELNDVTVNIKEREILKNVSFRIDSGLTLVTGTVGSGKSSLLKAILQDYPLTSGHLVTRGRISYASQDPWLFPSSIRQNILFGQTYDEKRYQEVIRVCALEYDLGLFDKGDETIVIDKGLNLSRGQQARVNLARAIYKESEIYLLDDSLTALDTHVRDYIFNECIKKYLKNKICVLVTQTANHIEEADSVIIMDKASIKSWSKPDDKIIREIKNLVLEDDDLEKEVISDNITTIENEEAPKELTALLETEQTTTNKNIYREIKKKGKVDFLVYKKYIIFGGGFVLAFANIALIIISQGSDSYSDKLVTKWVDEQQKVLELQNTFSRYVEINDSSPFNMTIMDAAIDKEQSTMRLYSIFIIVSTTLALIKTYASLDFCRRASIKIHKTMVGSIIESTMAFFDTHFIGNILNRFSQDLINTDEYLPLNITECFRVFFAVMGITILIAIVNKMFLIYVFIIFTLVLILRRVYLPAGRSLKRLEAASRSPMIGHLNASLEGLTTIRACKAENILIEEFDRHQDLFTSAHFTALCSLRAFGFFVDFICSLFVIMVVTSFIFADTDTSAGNVGLAITQVVMLSSVVQWGVRQWSELENLMTSVERLLEYTEIKSETKSGVTIPNWPSQGAIVYDNVSLSYNNTEKVLKNLKFSVAPKQKVGIVGRTGAGKSSIISSIFRLYEVEGKILIDGVDIKSLTLKFLRKKLAIIPQDPVLFTGTVRSNLDPLTEFSDEELWNVLGNVGLKNTITSLDFKISNNDSVFSSGQKQLICLSRAILRKSKIVILDEATANMDHETDLALHKTMKENFSDCTVITIAHRLHTILECDIVMVLDRGEIKELDDPLSLIENEAGLFHNMVKQAGLLNYLS